MSHCEQCDDDRYRLGDGSAELPFLDFETLEHRVNYFHEWFVSLDSKAALNTVYKGFLAADAIAAKAAVVTRPERRAVELRASDKRIAAVELAVKEVAQKIQQMYGRENDMWDAPLLNGT